MSWGIRILLSRPDNPLPEAFDVSWRESPAECTPDAGQLWDIVRYWLKQIFPAHRIIWARKRSDLARTLSGLFLRVHFRQYGKDFFLIAAGTDNAEESHLALGQALLWLSHINRKGGIGTVPTIHVLVPSGSASILWHRAQYLNRDRIRAEVWEYRRQRDDDLHIRLAAAPAPPEEHRDFRWPVLGPFRWSPKLEQVINLAPECIRRHPRFQDYDSLRLWDLEFAKVTGPERDCIAFGVGTVRTELTADNFDSLRLLIQEILYYRRPDSPDTQHPYYRLQAERWLEALILDNIPHLFPEMAAESVYSQIPVYLGKDPGRIDILGADRHGTLVVMELKVTPDYDLPVQALDYWGRVIHHNNNGDFERRGYFSETRLNRRRPKLYLISPVFSFHDSTESLLRYLDPDLEVWKISINEDWRCGVRALRRACYRCRDME